MKLSYPPSKTKDIVMSPKTQGTKDWGINTMPDFTGNKAFVITSAFHGDIVNLLANAGFERALTLEESDVVVFGGGADVDPSLYGERRMACTSFNADRDIAEQFFYNKARRLGKTMFGICRGAQFLHVMNGGKLWQDVNNHGGTRHFIVDLEDDVRVLANSLHHQMLQLNDEIKDIFTMIAVCEDQVGTQFTDANLSLNLGRLGANANYELEIEAGSYLHSGCFFVQGHPEIGSVEYQTWTLHKLHDFMVEFQLSKQDMELVIPNTMH